MKLFDYLFGWLGGASDSGIDDVASGIDISNDTGCTINPASGLPMIDGCGGVDVGGSPFGMDIHHDDLGSSINGGLYDDNDTWTGTSDWNDSFSISPSNWDDQ